MSYEKSSHHREEYNAVLIMLQTKTIHDASSRKQNIFLMFYAHEKVCFPTVSCIYICTIKIYSEINSLITKPGPQISCDFGDINIYNFIYSNFL